MREEGEARGQEVQPLGERRGRGAGGTASRGKERKGSRKYSL